MGAGGGGESPEGIFLMEKEKKTSNSFIILMYMDIGGIIHFTNIS